MMFMPQYTPVKRNILHLWISKCQSYADSRFAEFLPALLASIHTGLIPHLCHLLFLPRVVHLAHFPATAVSLRFRKNVGNAIPALNKQHATLVNSRKQLKTHSKTVDSNRLRDTQSEGSCASPPPTCSRPRFSVCTLWLQPCHNS